jgi:hypothetical protein
MKKYLFRITIISLIIPMKLFALSSETIKKYPYQLLTNDYGILNEVNLKRYTEGMVPEPFNGKFNGLDYWQCFPTKKVSVWYEKGDYDSDEKIARGDPYIIIKVSPMEVHHYEPRRSFSLDYAQEKVKRWKQLMKNQQYVCIGGIFAGTHEMIENGKKITRHGWVYENLKTKKGCDSYFSAWCN